MIILSSRNYFPSTKLLKVFLMCEEYEAKICIEDFGPMASFWESFIDMEQIMLDSIRTSDWDLHLKSCKQMLV